MGGIKEKLMEEFGKYFIEKEKEVEEKGYELTCSIVVEVRSKDNRVSKYLLEAGDLVLFADPKTALDNRIADCINSLESAKKKLFN